VIGSGRTAPEDGGVSAGNDETGRMRTATKTRPKAAAAATRGSQIYSIYLLRGAFFCSGAAALCYQVVWLRKLATFFGNTTLATSVCLTAFMAGLALGSYVFGRWAEKLTRPYRTYAALELLIGAYGLVSLLLIDVVRAAYLSLARHMPLDSVPLVCFQFFSCFLVLLLPTALMGGTLPVGVKGVAPRLDAVGREVAWLYGLNTLGAALGVLLVGFFLLPKIGLQASVVLAALLNFAIGFGVRKFGRGTAGGGAPATGPTLREAPSTAPLTRALRVVLLVGFGLSGFAGLALEVAWARALCVLTGSSVYAFSAMLFAVLIGIALGSVLTARLFARRQATPTWFAGVEVGAGLSTLALVLIYPRLLHVFQRLVLDHLGDASGMIADQAFIVLVFLLVPSLLSGASFPLLSRVCAREEARLPRAIGAIYAANTLGCILGAFAAGFLLIPVIGVRETILVCAALYVVSGAAVLAMSSKRAQVAAGVALGVLISAFLLLPPWHYGPMYSGVFDIRVARSDIDDEELRKLIYYREGSTCTVSVYGEPGVVALKVNGKTDASSTYKDTGTQALLAHLPLLLADHTDSALIVGLGSGATAGGATLHPVKRIDCVEIEPAMAQAATYFNDINHNVLSNDRFHLIFADARTYLATTPHRYDVIISEPSNPWVAGVSSLFTVEHFRACREKLAEDGVMCQWFHFYEMSPKEVSSVFASFLEVFPDATLWSADREFVDVLLVAKKHPWKVNYPRVVRRLQALPAVVEELKANSLNSPQELLAGLARGPKALQAIAKGRPKNTDDLPLLEFAAPLYLNDDMICEQNAKLIASAKDQPRDEYIDYGGPKSLELRKSLGEALASRYAVPAQLSPTMPAALAEFTAACREAPGRADLLEDLAKTEVALNDNISARQHLKQALKIEPGRASARELLEQIGD
jgi:spermidine synthase